MIARVRMQNQERGFLFCYCQEMGGDLFVHASAFFDNAEFQRAIVGRQLEILGSEHTPKGLRATSVDLLPEAA